MKIIEKLVVEAIVTFEVKAIEMINLLAKELSINLDSEHPFNYSEIKDKKRDTLNKEWTYWFHGGHCDFENQETKQYLHVSLYGGEKYKVFDYYYLYRFIQTTESLSSTCKLINSEEYFHKILFALEQDGTLINISKAPSGFPSRLLILNPDKEH